MAKTLFHPNTKLALEGAIAHETHALLISGPAGSGKSTLAAYVAASHLGVTVDRLELYPYFRLLGNEDKITVEAIRDIKQFLSLKTTGTRIIRRLVIIEQADFMNDECQNALLKVLEEPPEDTVIVLCASDAQALRDTIRSRCQTIQVLPPSKAGLEQYFMDLGFSPEAIEKAYRVSGGYIGLMNAMLQENTEHPLLIQVEQAKQILGASQFDRLRLVDQLSKQKPDVVLLLTALKRISTGALERAALKGQDASVTRWHATLQAVTDAEGLLKHNPSLKLLLTRLFLAL